MYYCKTIRFVDDTRTATPGANGVPYKLFITLLFNDHDVGVQFLKDVGLVSSSMVCCADHIFPGATTIVSRAVTDGDV